MRIAVSSDHAGYELKKHVVETLAGKGHEVVDLGPEHSESVDYPAYAAAAARLVAGGEADAGVIMCGSGVGVSIVANKVDGVRAVNAHDVEEAEISRKHNDANVLTLGARRLEPEEADEIVDSFLATPFEGGRHQRRVTQIIEIEHGGEASQA